MKEEKFLKLLEEMKEENATVPILVEGNKDIESLKKLGFEGSILKINEGMTLFSLAFELSQKYKKVIIFTDWDVKGNELNEKLVKYLHSLNIKYDTKYRTRTIRYSGKYIKSVEEIYSFAKQCEESVKS